MLKQQSAFLYEMLNPFIEIELSGFYPYKVSTHVSSAQTLAKTQVSPLEAECVIILIHVPFT
jgi:hypothetical protein